MTYVNRTKLSVMKLTSRSEAQTVSKIQVQNVFVQVAKFTSLKMYSSLLVFISKKSDVIDVLSMLSWPGMGKWLIQLLSHVHVYVLV